VYHSTIAEPTAAISDLARDVGQSSCAPADSTRNAVATTSASAIFGVGASESFERPLTAIQCSRIGERPCGGAIS
jgi:hypothetical protein